MRWVLFSFVSAIYVPKLPLAVWYCVLPSYTSSVFEEQTFPVQSGEFWPVAISLLPFFSVDIGPVYTSARSSVRFRTATTSTPTFCRLSATRNYSKGTRNLLHWIWPHCGYSLPSDISFSMPLPRYKRENGALSSRAGSHPDRSQGLVRDWARD